MTLTGMLNIHTKQSGIKYLSAVVSILVCVLCLAGCASNWSEWLVGDGRGDWTLELFAGYNISKINSREILVGHKENPEDVGNSIVIFNYYVTAYQTYEPYIYLEGIQTQNISISNEELELRELSYYLIDSTSGDIKGPFDSIEDFINFGVSLGLDMDKKWVNTE